MTSWVVFIALVVALGAIVRMVFRTHRPHARAMSRLRTPQPNEADAKPSNASAAAEPRPVTDAAPSPVIAAPSEATPNRSAPQVHLPKLDLPDGEDEPQTVVTRRFKPQALAAFLETDGDREGGSMPFGFILVSAVGRTDVGRHRKQNEDSYLIYPDEHVFVVADGMGGHAAGEVASAIAVESLLHAFTTGEFEGEPVPDRPHRADELVRAIEGANRAIYARGEADDSLYGMGTTVVAARFAPTRHRVFIAHVGDSRCYRLRNGVFQRLTADHTLSAYGIRGREGEKLARALGTEPTVEVDIAEDAPEARDQYLLCSDGLTKMLDDDEIRATLLETNDPEAAVRSLIERANERGGKDNVTVVIIQVHDASSL